MELPIFISEQPGCTYYYSPLSVYNLGVVNHAHLYDNGIITEHMHCHVYNEGVGKRAQIMLRHWLLRRYDSWIFSEMIQLAVSVILFLTTALDKTKTIQSWSLRHGYGRWDISKRLILFSSLLVTQKMPLTDFLTHWKSCIVNRIFLPCRVCSIAWMDQTWLQSYQRHPKTSLTTIHFLKLYTEI